MNGIVTLNVHGGTYKKDLYGANNQAGQIGGGLFIQHGFSTMITARSIGEANVQVILEELGGGGNTAIAGAQITGSTVKEVLDRLVASIDKFYEE